MKWNGVKKRSFGMCCALFMALSIVLIPSLVLAELNANSHWLVEITLRRRNSVYGTVSGLNIANGDSIGMFDADGNCHGAGVYRGNYYALTAFMREEADLTNPGDQTIEGFVEGEEVFFKVYRESTGEEYAVTHSSGNPYNFRYQGLTPLTKIDLVYEDEGGDTPPPPDAPPTSPDPVTPPSDTTGDAPLSTPMGVWAWSPEEEGGSGMGGLSSESASTGSGGSKGGSGFQDTAALDPMSGRSIRTGSGSSGTPLGSIIRAKPASGAGDGAIREDGAWKNALRNIENIINRPFSKRRSTGESKKTGVPAKKGMPLGTKLLFLFMAPTLAAAGIGIKLMR